MKRHTAISFFILFAACIGIAGLSGGCGIYGFSEKSNLGDSIKTVYVNYIENQASYINPQLSPNLTDRIRRKITSQTKLTQKNNDNADLVISGTIREYSVTTTGISSNNGQRQTSVNRLTVTVHMVYIKGSSTQEADVSRSFDFSANQSLQAAEAALLDEMVRNLTDEIFNRIFSDW
jgi:hypothetical protein